MGDLADDGHAETDWLPSLLAHDLELQHRLADARAGGALAVAVIPDHVGQREDRRQTGEDNADHREARRAGDAVVVGDALVVAGSERDALADADDDRKGDEVDDERPDAVDPRRVGLFRQRRTRRRRRRRIARRALWWRRRVTALPWWRRVTALPRWRRVAALAAGRRIAAVAAGVGSCRAVGAVVGRSSRFHGSRSLLGWVGVGPARGAERYRPAPPADCLQGQADRGHDLVGQCLPLRVPQREQDGDEPDDAEADDISHEVNKFAHDGQCRNRLAGLSFR